MKKKLFALIFTLGILFNSLDAFAYMYNITPFQKVDVSGIIAYQNLYQNIPYKAMDGNNPQNNNRGIKGIKFSDLDKDGIPELIVNYLTDPAPTPEGYEPIIYSEYIRIYTLNNNIPVLLYDFRYDNVGIFPQSYKVSTTYDGEGNLYVSVKTHTLGGDGESDIYEILYKDGNSIKRKSLFFQDAAAGNISEYKIDKNPVTLENYAMEIKKYLNYKDYTDFSKKFSGPAYYPNFEPRQSMGYDVTMEKTFLAALREKEINPNWQ